jgi:nicotinamide-nucleotide amidase
MEGAIVIDNQNGTAPGQIAELKDGKRIILMPGPPNELYPMFEHDVFPYLKKLQPYRLYSKMVKICGIGESKAETELADLIENQKNPTIAPYAKTSEVHFRVTASGKTDKEAEELVLPVVEELKRRFKDKIYSIEEDENLEDAVVTLLKNKNLTVSFAESCTGGLIAGKLVNVPGASEVLGVGFVTYSNEAKMKYLNVKESTLEQYGAVSEQTAEEMAIGAAKAAGSNTAVAVTGIAGPDGGTKEKPVGLVYVGCYVNGKVTVKELRLQGNRQKVREATVIRALDLLRRCIIDSI